MSFVAFWLSCLTIADPAWLEVVGLDPDHGDGVAEAVVLLVAVVVALVSAVRCRGRLWGV